jgi:uncharacterized membrane protein YuzA (DUF378 family)
VADDEDYEEKEEEYDEFGDYVPCEDEEPSANILHLRMSGKTHRGLIGAFLIGAIGFSAVVIITMLLNANFEYTRTRDVVYALAGIAAILMAVIGFATQGGIYSQNE